MLLCMRCGSLNRPDLNYCNSCGASLPKMAYSMEMASIEKNFELYERFRDVTNGVKAGTISTDNFAVFMNKMYEILSARADEIRSIEIEEDLIEDFSEELETGMNGVDMVFEGLDIMNLYVQDKNSTNLDNGLETFRQGLEMVHKAKVVNREREKKFDINAELYKFDSSIEL